MIYNITAEQQVFLNLDMQASTWAWRIMTRKITNKQCKFEIAQQINNADDMQSRVRKYLNAGLVTEATFKNKSQNQIERIKQHAKAPSEDVKPILRSKDGLWSKSVLSNK